MAPIRAAVTPVMLAVEAIITGIQVGGATLKAGLGVAPDGCPPPYAIITRPSGGTLTGTLADPEADADHRIQVVGVGDLELQALLVIDRVREAMTIPALQTAFDDLDTAGEANASRRVSMIFIDISSGSAREERGLPEPLFSEFDQYIIRTHPK
jgi:hypothetical protein